MRSTIIAAAIAIVASFLIVPSQAAEIVIRAKCECSGPVVTLGDIAEINGAEINGAQINGAQINGAGQGANERLAAVDLFPAPPAGRELFLHVREIQDILALRGEDIARHRFSGSSRIAIKRSCGVKQAAYEKPISDATSRSANRRVHDAVLDYLKSSSASTKAWTVDLTLMPEQIRPFLGPVRQIAVGGGKSPWTGPQRFRITVVRQDQPPVEFEVDAQVTLPDSVVVARRAIPRDTILTAADLAICPDVSGGSDIETLSTIEEAVGRQTTRTISVGKVIDKQWIRSPLLVRRGEIVTVTASASGIRVSTNARARGDGSLGELISVESLHDRKTFYARVCGTRETEVFAPPVRTPGVAQPTENARRSENARPAGHALQQPRSARNDAPKRFEKGNLQ